MKTLDVNEDPGIGSNPDPVAGTVYADFILRKETGQTAHVSPAQAPSISWKYLLISVSLSLASMAVVLYLTYSPGVLEHLKPKRLPGLALAIVVSLLRVVVSAWRIRFLSDGQLGWMASIRLMLTWDFASSVTPSTIGGAPFATYAMTREGVVLGKSTTMVLYGVLLDQFWYALAVPLLLVFGLYLDVVPREIGFVGQATMVVIYSSLILYGAVLFYGLLVNPSTMGKVINRVFTLRFLRRFQEKIRQETLTMEQHSTSLKGRSTGFLFKGFLITVLSWLLRISLPVIVVLSLLPANELLLAFRSLSMHLAALVVPTPGGSGGVEGLFYLFIGPLISREGFVGLAIFAWRIISYYISVGLGIMAMSWYFNTPAHARPNGAGATPTPASTR